MTTVCDSDIGDMNEYEEEFSPDEDEEFQTAVIELTEMANNASSPDLTENKKRKLNCVNVSDEERAIVHKMYGCRHCKCKFGNEEDYNTIHKKIDDIFKLMKQTVTS